MRQRAYIGSRCTLCNDRQANQLEEPVLQRARHDFTRFLQPFFQAFIGRFRLQVVEAAAPVDSPISALWSMTCGS